MKKILLLSLVLAGCPDPIESDTDPVVGAGPAEELAWSAPADGLELQGTLTLPERDGPVPVVVLVHGSGPNGRDAVMAGQFNMGFGFELRAFEQIAAGLQERGVAVYRYDKRTCVTGDCAGNGYPTPSGELLVDDFVADGVAAAASLTASEAIDPETSARTCSSCPQGFDCSLTGATTTAANVSRYSAGDAAGAGDGAARARGFGGALAAGSGR